MRKLSEWKRYNLEMPGLEVLLNTRALTHRKLCARFLNIIWENSWWISGFLKIHWGFLEFLGDFWGFLGIPRDSWGLYAVKIMGFLGILLDSAGIFGDSRGYSGFFQKSVRGFWSVKLSDLISLWVIEKIMPGLHYLHHFPLGPPWCIPVVHPPFLRLIISLLVKAMKLKTQCECWGFLATALCGFVIFAKISCGFAGSGIPLTPHSITVLVHGISTVAYGRSRTRCYPYTMAALGHEVNLLWPFSNMTSYYGLSRTWPPFTMAVLVQDVMYENGHSDGQKFFFFFFWKKSFGRPRPPYTWEYF